MTASGDELRRQLKAVGAEKATARAERRGPAHGEELLYRLVAPLWLYEDLRELRHARLVSELGDAVQADAALKKEEERRDQERENATLTMQARIYGLDLEQNQKAR